MEGPCLLLSVYKEKTPPLLCTLDKSNIPKCEALALGRDANATWGKWME